MAAWAAVAAVAVGAHGAGSGAFGCGWLRRVILCEVVACFLCVNLVFLLD